MRRGWRDGNISGRLWPVHLKPKDDEILSSWLVRLAWAHGLKIQTFCAIVFGREKQIWNRDIDRLADREVLVVLAEKTATPFERACRTTLAAYEGFLFEEYAPCAIIPWIMRVGVYHRVRTRFGLQFCPTCLAEDDDPYFRRKWRLAFATYCGKHEGLLLDRCPRCGSPVVCHRGEMGDRNRFPGRPVTACWRCGRDLRRAKPGRFPAGTERPGFQEKLLEVLGRGWADVPGSGPVYSNLYFAGFRRVAKALAGGRRKGKAWKAAVAAGGLPGGYYALSSGRREIEMMGVAERFRLCFAASRLLEDWPNQFVGFCEKHEILSTDLLRDSENPPFWYWNVVNERLSRPNRVPTKVEVEGALSFLRRAGFRCLKADVSRLLGFRDVFRKRKSLARLAKSLEGGKKEPRSRHAVARLCDEEKRTVRSERRTGPRRNSSLAIIARIGDDWRREVPGRQGEVLPADHQLDAAS